MEKEFVTNCGGIKPNLTVELVFILDKSGSMSGMEKDTIGGFNSMIERQKSLNDGKVYVTTILFSNSIKMLHDREILEEIQPLTEQDYQVGGSTALLDAIGDTICHISYIHKYIHKEDVPNKTMFVITTDGFENASRNYRSEDIKKMIKEKEEKCGWEFLFLASNIDAVETASSLGIRKERAVNYVVEEDTKEMFEEVGDTIRTFRTCNAMPEDYGKIIEKNIKKRKKKSK